MLRNLLVAVAMAFGAVVVAAPPTTVTAESETVFIVAANPQQVGDYLRMNPDAVLDSMGMKVQSRDKTDVKVRISNLLHQWEFTVRESEDKEKSQFKHVMIENHKGGMIDAENTITFSEDKFGTRVTVWTKATISQRGVTAKEVQRELVKGQKSFSTHMQAKLKK
jgi:hypothetical protein